MMVGIESRGHIGWMQIDTNDLHNCFTLQAINNIRNRTSSTFLQNYTICTAIARMKIESTKIVNIRKLNSFNCYICIHNTSDIFTLINIKKILMK